VARSDAASADSDPSKSAAKCSASSSTCVVQPWPEPLLPMDPETQKSNRSYELVPSEHSASPFRVSCVSGTRVMDYKEALIAIIVIPRLLL